MAEVALLAKVKNCLGVSGTYQDAMLQLYIDEVKVFMKDAGVPEATIDSDSSAGVIIRGVADLWNLESGSVKFSEYFKMRVTQLALSKSLEESQNV